MLADDQLFILEDGVRQKIQSDAYLLEAVGACIMSRSGLH